MVIKYTIYIIAIFIIGCVGKSPIPLPEYDNYGVKSYIIDKYNLKYHERGIYDINRNDEVDIEIDYFFFTKNPFEKGGAHVWYLHELLMWEDIDGEVSFKIGQYPIKILVDYSGEGTPDIRYWAKPGIEHAGYVKLYNDMLEYNKKIGD